MRIARISIIAPSIAEIVINKSDESGVKIELWHGYCGINHSSS